jgi:hypothetical protein
LACLVAGCPDPAGKYNEFNQRVPFFDAMIPIDAPPLSSIPDISGSFYMGVRTSLSAADKQEVIFLVTNVMTPQPDKTALLTSTLTPLSHWEDIPKHVVETAATTKDIRISSSGEYTAPLAELRLSEQANNINMQTAIVINLVFTGSIKSTDRYCGILKGELVEPIAFNLEGSTFSAIRVSPDVVLDSLPDPPESSCPTATPDAGPSDAAPDAAIVDAAPASG